MWRVEYIGEDSHLFGKEGWAEPGPDADTLSVKLDGQWDWNNYKRSDFEDIEYGR